jgi:hypothetical protein
LLCAQSPEDAHPWQIRHWDIKTDWDVPNNKKSSVANIKRSNISYLKKYLTLLSIFTIIIFMETLDYLVTSDCRKSLLKLLWGEGLEASTNQLKKLTQHPYSSVYKELESMRKAGLVDVKNVGRASVYSKKNDTKLNKLMELLLDQKPKSDNIEPTDEDVKVNLVRYGAPLAWDGQTNLDLSIEQTLTFALPLARQEAAVARSLPVVFARHQSELDYSQLEFLASQLNAKQTLGFFLDLTAHLSKNHKMKKIARALRDKRNRIDRPFFHSEKTASETMKKIMDLRTPNLAKRWHYQMNMSLQSFETLFNKFVKGV